MNNTTLAISDKYGHLSNTKPLTATVNNVNYTTVTYLHQVHRYRSP